MPASPFLGYAGNVTLGTGRYGAGPAICGGAAFDSIEALLQSAWDGRPLYCNCWASSVGPARKVLVMSFQRFAFDTCPRCYEPIELATIEPSPARRDLVLHNFTCADCGSVKTKVLSLKPGEPLPEPAAYRSCRSDRVRPLFAKDDTPTIILLVEDSPGDIRL